VILVTFFSSVWLCFHGKSFDEQKLNIINHVINIIMKYFTYHFCSKYFGMLGSAFTVIAITNFM